MFRKTTLVLGFVATFAAATPAFADPATCKDGYVEKKGGDVVFCIREQDAKAFQAWAERCEKQAEVREKKGLKGSKVAYTKDDKGRPHCHVEGGYVESGALD